MFKRIAAIVALFITCAVASGQQPQTQSNLLMGENVKYVQGVGIGYWPTAGSGLTLNIAPGTVNCGGTIKTYGPTSGTLTMTASATNYVYLDPSSSCTPTSNTSGFTASVIPIATVVTGSSTISTVTDDRTLFFLPGSGASFTAGGDLSGSNTSQTVIGLLGHALPTLAPGYPHWNGTTWVFDTPSGGGGGGLCSSVDTQTGTSYSLVLTDGTVSSVACIGTVTMNNAATNTITVPANSSVAFPIPDEIDFIQLGVGQTCIAAASGVTLNTPTSLCARAQNSTFGIRQIATNVWQVFGDTQ